MGCAVAWCPHSGSDPLQGLKDGGSYEDRDTRPGERLCNCGGEALCPCHHRCVCVPAGASDNERKAFKKASGQYMVCMWSAATQKWIDVSV